MSADTPLETLRRVPLFENLGDEELAKLSSVATTERCEQGELVLREGAQSQNLWIVLEGACEVVRGDNSHQVVLAELVPYDNFGEMSFFHAAPHSAGVRAKTDVQLLRITREAFDALIRDGDGGAYKIAYNSVESLADRLRRMDQWVAELTREAKRSRQSAEWGAFRETLFTNWNL